ncbi:MAG: cupin domain-containing protein [Pseudomonadota bacterium]
MSERKSLVIGPNDGESWWQPLPSRGYVSTYITPENNPYHDFSSGIQVLPPGGEVREHGHTINHELVFIYQGEGVITIEGEDHPVSKGCSVLFADNETHIIRNTGDEDMHMFWVFMPPRLEEWFRAIGKPRQPGDTMPDAFPRPDGTAEAMEFQRFIKPKAD